MAERAKGNRLHMAEAVGELVRGVGCPDYVYKSNFCSSLNPMFYGVLSVIRT